MIFLTICHFPNINKTFLFFFPSIPLIHTILLYVIVFYVIIIGLNKGIIDLMKILCVNK